MKGRVEEILLAYVPKHITLSFFTFMFLFSTVLDEKAKHFPEGPLCCKGVPLVPWNNLYIWWSFGKNFSLYMFKKDIWNWQLHLLTILSLVGFTVWIEPPQGISPSRNCRLMGHKETECTDTAGIEPTLNTHHIGWHWGKGKRKR